jgi:hypothetical protein
MCRNENTLQRLELWYGRQCDGNWEHEYGVKIGNLDNPGWEIDIDLAGTGLEEKALESSQLERDEHDWISYRKEDLKFRGFGGPRNLDELLLIFLEWAEKNARK